MRYEQEDTPGTIREMEETESQQHLMPQMTGSVTTDLDPPSPELNPDSK